MAKIMSDVFIVDLFYFQINTNSTMFAASNQHFTGMPEYIKHMILSTVQVFYIYNKNNLHHFSIFPIYPFLVCLSLCASTCAA